MRLPTEKLSQLQCPSKSWVQARRFREMPMIDDAALYREFEEALTEVLAEKEYSLDRRTRLAKARAVVDNRDPRYREAVDRAFLVLN
jgi:hypothetical protein